MNLEDVMPRKTRPSLKDKGCTILLTWVNEIVKFTGPEGGIVVAGVEGRGKGGVTNAWACCLS